MEAYEIAMYMVECQPEVLERMYSVTVSKQLGELRLYAGSPFFNFLELQYTGIHLQIINIIVYF
ncbi:hypothetical protein HMPREF1210_01413 [Paenisporosarcina sp. HGH0030]|nr:hypothetical protein HMPREF1210_01413 [Paenisporosarcina sp. HGH0030]